LFVQALAKGKTQIEAYVAAGYAPNDGHAARLAGNGRVVARLVELQTRAADRVVTTAVDIASQLDEDRAFARALKQGSAAVSATMGKAKVLGLVVDRHAGPTGGAIPFRFDLSGLSDEELEQLEQLRSRIAVAGRDQSGADQAAG
jgi:hypothetical protein